MLNQDSCLAAGGRVRTTGANMQTHAHDPPLPSPLQEGNNVSITNNTVSVDAAGAAGEVQIHSLSTPNTFATGTRSVSLAANGDLSCTTHDVGGSGEVKAAGFYAVEPSASDTKIGASTTLSDGHLFKHAIRNGTATQNTGTGWDQGNFVTGYNSGGDAGYGFPANRTGLLWHSWGAQAMCRNAIVGFGRPSTLAAITGEMECMFGNQTALGTDQAYYDPLNLRTRQTGVNNTYRGIGYNSNSLSHAGMLKIHALVEGVIAGNNSNKHAVVVARRYNSSDVAQGSDLTICHRSPSNRDGDPCFFSGERTIYTWGGDASEKWEDGDYFRVTLKNTSTHVSAEFEVATFMVVAEWWPVP